MWIRARFDIDWKDIWAAGLYCVMPSVREDEAIATEHAWDDQGRAIATLSVRSAFDLTLRALDLPPNSEVLLTALTIPDMVRIVVEHGLIPIPVDVNEAGMICLTSLESVISNRSRVLVVAHLFGGTCDMNRVIKIAQKHQLLVIEDCAQSFTAVGCQGHLASDVVMHSFGTIKTATAVGGGVVYAASEETRRRMRQILASDPIQTRVEFFIRLMKLSVLKLTAGYYASSAFMWILHLLTMNVDAMLNSLGRGFTRKQLLRQIRVRPSSPLLRLMRRRWSTYDFTRIDRRKSLGRRLDRLLAQSQPPDHSRWVYPLFLPSADKLACKLRAHGFDATQLSRMTIVPDATPSRSAPVARRIWKDVLFLPWYVELTEDAVDEMGQIVRSHQIGE